MELILALDTNPLAPEGSKLAAKYKFNAFLCWSPVSVNVASASQTCVNRRYMGLGGRGYCQCHVRVWTLDPTSTRIMLSIICLYKATLKMTAEVYHCSTCIYSMPVVSRADPTTVVVRSKPLSVSGFRAATPKLVSRSQTPPFLIW